MNFVSMMHFRILKTIFVYLGVAATFELLSMLISFGAGNGVFQVSGIRFYAVFLGGLVAFLALIPPAIVFFVWREDLMQTIGQRIAFSVAASLHVAFLVAMVFSVASRQGELFYGLTFSPQRTVEAIVEKKEMAYYEGWIESNERVACSMMVHYLLEEDYPQVSRVDFSVQAFGISFPMQHSSDRFMEASNADVCVPYVLKQGDTDIEAKRYLRALYLYQSAEAIPMSAKQLRTVRERIYEAKRVIREAKEADPEFAKRARGVN